MWTRGHVPHASALADMFLTLFCLLVRLQPAKAQDKASKPTVAQQRESGGEEEEMAVANEDVGELDDLGSMSDYELGEPTYATL